MNDGYGGNNKFEASVPKPLFDIRTGLEGWFDVSKNDRFLIPTPIEASVPITIVVNWTAGLKKIRLSASVRIERSTFNIPPGKSASRHLASKDHDDSRLAPAQIGADNALALIASERAYKCWVADERRSPEHWR